jgi:hypothetical protein
VQFATQITANDQKKPLVSCRDKLLPEVYALASGSVNSCDALMKLPEDVLSKLDWYSFQRADGAVTVGKLRALPSPSELDEQSDERHITEYQRQLIEPVIKKYAGARLLVFFAGGQKSKQYADEFRDMFRAKGWRVEGPKLVPIGDERIIDVQISVNYKENWAKETPKPHDVWNAFEQAGIKQRRGLVNDPAVASGLIVLWVGPKSPKDARPDQCATPELKPRPGEHHTCEMIAQSQGACPFVPQ